MCPCVSACVREACHCDVTGVCVSVYVPRCALCVCGEGGGGEGFKSSHPEPVKERAGRPWPFFYFLLFYCGRPNATDHQRAQGQGHHSVCRLEERGALKGSSARRFYRSQWGHSVSSQSISL